MMRKALFGFLAVLFSVGNVVVLAQDAATLDVALGLQGLMEAAKDPALLAQLMQDLQVSSWTSNYSVDSRSNSSGPRAHG